MEIKVKKKKRGEAPRMGRNVGLFIWLICGDFIGKTSLCADIKRLFAFLYKDCKNVQVGLCLWSFAFGIFIHYLILLGWLGSHKEEHATGPLG